MAEHRMLSKRIIGSTKFLKMPIDTRDLYFYLNVYADDDGIVEAYQVMKLTGSPEDNLRVLAAKGYVKILNEDLVTYIMDWREHNNLRADRKINSIHQELLLQIMPEVELLEPKQRADRKKKEGRPKDGQGTEEVKLSKDRLGKVMLYYQEVLKIFYDTYRELYNEKLVIDDKMGKQIKYCIDKALNVNKENPINVIKDKIDILKKNDFFTCEPATLLSQWSKLVNKNDNKTKTKEKPFTAIQSKSDI